MLENGMVVGADAEWDAICEAGAADAAVTESLLQDAERDLRDPAKLRDAVNEAQASGGVDGSLIADLLFGLPEARWAALQRLARELIDAAAVNRMYSRPGVRSAEYAHVDADALPITTAQLERVASLLARLFGAVGVAA
jgi:hypothetical protein